MATRAARNQKAYRDRRKAKLALLEERFIRGTILRIEEADMWGKQEIKLILDADAQEAGAGVAEMFGVDVHELMHEQLTLNIEKLYRVGRLKRLEVGGGE